jgi:hypothetical protein
MRIQIGEAFAAPGKARSPSIMTTLPQLHAFPRGQTGHLPRTPFRRSNGTLHGMRGSLLFATRTSKAERHQEGRDAEDDPHHACP